MRTLHLALLALLSCAAPVAAQWRPMPAPETMPGSGSTGSGTQSGNSYSPNRDSADSPGRGESDSRADPDSSSDAPRDAPQRSVDSQGNVWYYNPRTGMSWSSNGRVCGGPVTARGCY
jgi:hypothetical protein